MCQTVVICFERMHGMLSEEDQFIDLKALKKCNLQEPTGRFKACQRFTEYLKHLGYFYNLSFNVFLFPNKKETRQLLGFLFELIFREENASQAKKKQERPTNQLEQLVKRRLTKWTKKPWLMPEFADGQAQGMLIGGEVINVAKDIDFERVAASKSKKAKTLYQTMINSMSITRAADLYKSGMGPLGISINQASWSKGQITLTQERNNDMFHGEDEDFMADGENSGQGVAIGNRMINKAFIMEDIVSRVAVVQSSGEANPEEPAAAASVNMEAEKSIKEIIEERQEQLKDLEQLQDIKQSQFVDALTNDIEGGAAASVEAPTTALGAESQDKDAGDVDLPTQKQASAAPSNTGASAFDEMQEKLQGDLETLVKDKEAEIQELVTVLDSLKAEIGKSEI